MADGGMDKTFATRKAELRPTLDASDGRRRRDEHQIKIRKDKRESRLNKRRMAASARVASAAPAAPPVAMPSSLREIFVSLNSASEDQQLVGTMQIRKLLSIGSCSLCLLVLPTFQPPTQLMADLS
jgi:hypothetical protein